MRYLLSRERALSLLTMLFVLISLATPVSSVAQLVGSSGAPQTAWGAIEQNVLDILAQDGTTDIVVQFFDVADLSPAHDIADWNERGQFVYDTLERVAERSQTRAIAYLQERGLTYRSFKINNTLLVRGADLEVTNSLAAIPGVRLVRAPRAASIPEPPPGAVTESSPDAVEWGIAFTNADDVWVTHSVTGQGIVVANIDTGVMYTHAALVNQYRGNLGGGTFDHTYSWYMPTYGCPDPGTPCDNDGHGTHTMGTMVGDDGGSNQIGMAPDAEWIACKGCESLFCSEEALTGCADWILAPGDDPSMRPHVVNNSWGGGGGDNWYLSYVNAWRAAGIFPAFSAGNSGPTCYSLGSPGDYQESFGSAAHDSSGLVASFSSRGPSAFSGPRMKPNIIAPGVNVRSSYNNGSYVSLNGTSMASPHTAGTVALIWSANPALVGQIEPTFGLIELTANHDAPAGNCGPGGVPNYTYGSGYLDAFAAVSRVAITGRLEGVVTDGISGLADVAVEAVGDGGGSQSTTTGGDGFYSMDLPADTYDVTFGKYGFRDHTADDVVVEKDQVTTLNATLAAADFWTISGHVTAQDSGLPLEAEIEILGTPEYTTSDPATGFYNLSVAEGVYTMRVAALEPGYGSQDRDVEVFGDLTEDFELSLAILLVDDDDNQPDVQDDYAEALDAIGYDYDVFDVGGGAGNGPDRAELAEYQVVIWFSGGKRSGGTNPLAGPNKVDESNLAWYLMQGGRLFLSSQDYLDDMGRTQFGRKALGLRGFSEEYGDFSSVVGLAGDPIGSAFPDPLPLSYPFEERSDVIHGRGTGVSKCFEETNGHGAGLDRAYDPFKTVFFAFPWEAIYNADPANGVAVLDEIVSWLAP